MDLDLSSKLEELSVGAIHPFLGIMPEQDWLNKHISWYNSRLGVISNCLLEILAGLEYAILYSHPEVLLLSWDGALRKPNQGSYALEVPWYLVKKNYYNFKNLSQKYNSKIKVDA